MCKVIIPESEKGGKIVKKIKDLRLPSKKTSTSQQRLNILKVFLPLLFIVWVATEYIIAIYFPKSETLIKFSNMLPFFLTTILGVIIGSVLDTPPKE